jgi:malate dehydrogenase (oxaloacetate-decarboxylating)(NADP+)
VLCFPYIFRGALDCGATKITEAMKLACVRQIADLAKADISEEVANAYAGKELTFGPDYLIPTPFDSRLILKIAPAVAKAAAESGVATRPIEDMEAYKESLSRFVYQTGMLMRPVINAAKALPDAQKRVAYADGEDERALRAAQMAIDDKIAHPILIGRPAVIAARIAKAGLRMQIGQGRGGVQPSKTIPLPPVLGNLPPAHEAQRRHARGGQGCRAPLQHHHRLADGQAGRCRRHDLRPGGHL